ncbi:CLUMA_CG020940, isoform A [Clunio marinus]|uniref:CLUMA_CG020940, isoform A n=1 Tax=Clunio marinus TaxID=568069 RepID=A0A1J1J6T9_9DIPT|nr:CLUMA_CG020940, isoform A [Clunio marinus]
MMNMRITHFRLNLKEYLKIKNKKWSSLATIV